MDGEGIQHVGVLVDLDGTDLNDLPSERLLDAVIIKDKRLIADVPLKSNKTKLRGICVWYPFKK